MKNCMAVLVTRGDVELTKIVDSLHHAIRHAQLLETPSVVLWDNSCHLDFGPFGQYIAATRELFTELLYFQDDDCITDPAQIIAAWEPGKIVCNMPAEFRANYENQPDKLMGFGSCFERSLIRPTFERYFRHFAIDPVLLREPNRIFTGLNQDRIKLVDVPKRDLPWATAPNRLYRQPDHLEMAEEARRRVRVILEREKR